MAKSFGIGVANNVTNTIIAAVLQKLTDVMELEGNLHILDTDFTTMEAFLIDIRTQFHDQQKRLPRSLERCLIKMDNALREATDLMNQAKRHGERAWFLRCCCVLCNPNIPTQIRAWNARFDSLFQELERNLSISAHTPQIVSAAELQADLLLQPVPDSGFIGSAIRSAQDQLHAWLTEPHCQARVIGIYGMAGVGKTSLLKLIYNTYKKEVSGIFDFVLWFTVSRNFHIKELQASIAKELKFSLDETSTIEERKMRLYASLPKKNYLLVLDDVWSPIDLVNEVGIRMGNDNRSKIIISSRSKEVIGTMGGIEYSMSIQPLSTEEGWQLFRRGAFTNGVVLESNIEEIIAREIAAECKGLPLAINAVAAALSWKKMNDEWSRALIMMKNADPSFPTTHKTIDAELYQKLRWSYNDLSDPNLQICFLYCAAFPEDAYIDVQDLVQMWSGEGLVTQRGTTYLMDIAGQYIDVLVNRCLVQCISELGIKYRFLRVHDVMRDMAIHIGQQEENWLFGAGQHLQNFPTEEQTRDCKRISLSENDIHDLPMDFRCPKLLSLVLGYNQNLRQLPEGFLSNLVSLRVLDLSGTSISSLPTSLGKLGQLELINLSGCSSLKDLPESICNLRRLQFLDLGWCEELQALPTRIGELKNLKHLSLYFCDSLMEIPHDIFQLVSLNRLFLPIDSCAMSIEDLANLSNLLELKVAVKPQMKLGTMGTVDLWLEMRDLFLNFKHDADTDRDVAAEDFLIPSIKHMKKLEQLFLMNYEGATLPNSICQFQNLKSLCLEACDQLRELPALELGSGNAPAPFPVLENIELRSLPKLESIIRSSSVCTERTLVKLESLHIENCPFTKKLLLQVGKLPNLKGVIIGWCDDLTELVFKSGDFPVLESLNLYSLSKLESMTGPIGLWNEGTLPKMESLGIRDCPLLRRLPSGIEKMPNLKRISGERDWWQNIIWEDAQMKVSLSHLFRARDD